MNLSHACRDGNSVLKGAKEKPAAKGKTGVGNPTRLDCRGKFPTKLGEGPVLVTPAILKKAASKGVRTVYQKSRKKE
jgi:hypothetical protein